MSIVALELDRLLSRLDPRVAETLEGKVREAMSLVAENAARTPTLEEMKKRRPELAELIGSLADVDFEIPPELPLPAARTW